MVEQNGGDRVALSTLESGRPVEEVEESYEYTNINWKDFVRKKKYIPWWIFGIAISILLAILTLRHDQIVNAMRPVSEKIRAESWGFVIPVIILVVISFPPLFGHEIIALLCGVVYGLWIGFAIVAAGTFLGETATWFAFKYALRSRAVKLERKNLNYGALARLTRDGGFWIVLVIRFSILPTHFSTAVFSTCGVNFWFFEIATFLTLPKQIFLVYVGVLFTQSKETKDNKINTIVIGLTFIVTVVAGVYIYMKLRKIKKVLLEEQAQRLMAKQTIPVESNVQNAPFRPDDSHQEVPFGGNQNRAPQAPVATYHWQGAYDFDNQRRGMKEQEFI